MIRTSTIAAMATALVVAAAVACGKDSAGKSPTGPLSGTSANGSAASNGSTPGDSSGTSPAPAPTSNGPVATFTVSPHSATLQKTYWLALTATARDAQGVQVIVKPTWTSSDPSVVAVGDSGLVQGVAVGTAMIHATIDGFEDSALVTVIDTLPATPQPPTYTPVDSSNLPPPGNTPAPPPPGTDTTLSTHSR